MSGRTVAAKSERLARPSRARSYDERMEALELQMQLLMDERYGRVTDQVRFRELCDRAKAIGGELTKTFAFDEAGRVSAKAELKLATYQRPYWLTRKADDPMTETSVYDLPRQFAKLELALTRDERVYQETIASLAYGKEPPAIGLMTQPGFEISLQELARKAGGSLEMKAWNGKTYVYYYRYKRLRTKTVFSSLLTHLPYHTSGKHRYTFWMPVDYVLLRQLLEADAKIYAALPEEMKRPGYP